MEGLESIACRRSDGGGGGLGVKKFGWRSNTEATQKQQISSAPSVRHYHRQITCKEALAHLVLIVGDNVILSCEAPRVVEI
eukprot:gene736-biopygen9259